MGGATVVSPEVVAEIVNPAIAGVLGERLADFAVGLTATGASSGKGRYGVVSFIFLSHVPSKLDTVSICGFYQQNARQTWMGH